MTLCGNKTKPQKYLPVI